MENRIAKAYWIWLELSDSDNNYCKELQKKVQKTIKSPTFKPHLTVSGPINLIENRDILKKKFYELSKQIEPIVTNNLSFDYQNQYFQSFYIKIEKSNDLLKLKDSIDKKYGFLNNNNQTYMPHISLAYGNIPIKSKIKIMNSLGKLQKNFLANRISLIYANEEKLIWKKVVSISIKHDERS